MDFVLRMNLCAIFVGTCHRLEKLDRELRINALDLIDIINNQQTTPDDKHQSLITLTEILYPET